MRKHMWREDDAESEKAMELAEKKQTKSLGN
jgi:hypothetical protein